MHDNTFRLARSTTQALYVEHSVQRPAACGIILVLRYKITGALFIVYPYTTLKYSKHTLIQKRIFGRLLNGICSSFSRLLLKTKCLFLKLFSQVYTFVVFTR